MTRSRLGRRDALRLGGLSAMGAFLAACGVEGKGKPQASMAPDAVDKFWADKTRNGKLRFAGWPLYMDPKKPELKKFTQRTGIQVTYDEVIQEMAPWFAKVQPQLSAGQSIGYDVMVITNSSQFGQFRDSGFLAPLDHAKLPNYAANAAKSYATSNYDPGNVFSIPYASGITGIAYDPAKIKEPITKLSDLWNPKYKGKVGMFRDLQELGNFGLLALGLDPAKSTETDWQKAAAELKKQKDAGIVRNYYDQSYIDALGKGEVWITMAWSGDVFQKNVSDGTNFKFVIPEDGATIWTDNMAIPVTAENPVDAIMLMDFLYELENATTLAEYINYVCPVPAAQAQMRKHAAALTGEDKKYLLSVAESPLIFPGPAEYDRLHYYVDFNTAEEKKNFERVFQPIVLG
ncbi:polyamine ABC transporter substrate-binding protein [Actinoplanes flavus]|uniref:Spermidine/putrescine ABC transporter substrate-binding protein n=1 Tax=Actinoplanes flavus TaxID=2820290 RepID=A0ABS3UGY4_9ACTN|nr:spermidine/putrescine ABC transporter substrate-binding protein [Actinoplanes flavus]MBO3738039.1 spermidine/putrescine ABC transporter substrate-binding protein [Actinoplanes flavus]